MVKPTKKGESRPTCVNQLLNRLSETADAFQAGEPLGPYLVEALLEDIQLCPALEQADGLRNLNNNQVILNSALFLRVS